MIKHMLCSQTAWVPILTPPLTRNAFGQVILLLTPSVSSPVKWVHDNGTCLIGWM